MGVVQWSEVQRNKIPGSFPFARMNESRLERLLLSPGGQRVFRVLRYLDVPLRPFLTTTKQEKSRADESDTCGEQARKKRGVCQLSDSIGVKQHSAPLRTSDFAKLAKQDVVRTVLSASSFSAINWAGKESNSWTAVCVGLMGELRALYSSPTPFRNANGVEQCPKDGWPTHLVLEIMSKQSDKSPAHAPQNFDSYFKKGNLQACRTTFRVCVRSLDSMLIGKNRRPAKQAPPRPLTNLLGDSLGHDLKHVFVLKLVRQAAPHGVVLRAAPPYLLGARPGTRANK